MRAELPGLGTTASAIADNNFASGGVAHFPAGVSENIFNMFKQDPGGPQILSPDGIKPNRTTALLPRTFVIGISPEVGSCELNYTAFRGRTDAQAKKGDLGVNYAADTDLPQALGPLGSGSPYKGNAGHDYAFFARDASSLASAFIAIANATGSGDYATNSPTGGASAGLSNIALLASSEFPSWKGHFYALDLNYSVRLRRGTPARSW